MSSLPFLTTLHFTVNHYNLTYTLSTIIPFSRIAVLSCQITALPKSTICLLCLHNTAARDWITMTGLTSSLWPWPQCAWSSAQKPQFLQLRLALSSRKRIIFSILSSTIQYILVLTVRWWPCFSFYWKTRSNHNRISPDSHHTSTQIF